MPSKEPVRSIPARSVGADKAKVVDLLCHALQCELSAVPVYETAVRCAQSSALRSHWVANLAGARHRGNLLHEACMALGIAADQDTPGRGAVRLMQEAAVEAMEDSLADAPLDAAQIIAADCVVAMEARTEAAWRLIRILATALSGDRGKVLRKACKEVDDGPGVEGGTDQRAHELWLQAIGLPPTPSTRRLRAMSR